MIMSSVSLSAAQWPHDLLIADGHFHDLSFIYKFGYNDAVGTSEETVWEEGDIYAYPPSAEAMTISSSSVNDTAAGTGAQTARVVCLNANYLEVISDFSLNGQTGVAVGTLLRANRIEILTAGSGEENDGTIYIGSGAITAGVPANIYASIKPGRNQTMMALWTVPAGKTAFLKRFTVSTAGNANAIATVRLVMRPFGGVFQTKDLVKVSQAGGELVYEHVTPPPIAEKTDIEIRALGSTSMDVSASLDMYVKEG